MISNRRQHKLDDGHGMEENQRRTQISATLYGRNNGNASYFIIRYRYRGIDSAYSQIHTLVIFV
jgi:hypothetical protein